VVVDTILDIENNDGMANLQLTSSTLTVHFTRAEKIAGLVRNLSLPLAAVRDVEVVPDGLSAARGLRAPGLALPGRRKIGTWRRSGRRTLVSVRRDQPAVRIAVSGSRYDTLLIGTDDPTTQATALASALDAAR
jgi:hypothetical protein